MITEENCYISEQEALGCFHTEYTPPEDSPGGVERSEEDAISNVQIGWKKGYFGRTEDIYAERGAKYFCLVCSSVFNTRLSILTHSKMHKLHFCVLCCNYKSTTEEMELHMFQCHPEEVCVLENSPARSCDYEEVVDLQTSNDPSITTAEQSTQEVSPSPDICKTPKLRGRKKNRGNAQPPIKHFTKLVTSRFGRVITVKIPTY